jgi:hypothetical protein
MPSLLKIQKTSKTGAHRLFQTFEVGSKQIWLKSFGSLKRGFGLSNQKIAD